MYSFHQHRILVCPIVHPSNLSNKRWGKNGLFHLISIHPPRKSVNYVGGVNNGQKLMCPKGGPAQITNCVQGGLG